MCCSRSQKENTALWTVVTRPLVGHRCRHCEVRYVKFAICDDARAPPGAADSGPTSGVLARVSGSMSRWLGYGTPSPQAQEPSNSKSYF